MDKNVLIVEISLQVSLQRSLHNLTLIDTHLSLMTKRAAYIKALTCYIHVDVKN